MRQEKSRAGDPAREAAYEVLRAVGADDAYANLAMPAALRRHELRGRDAGLATELGYGTLRGQGTYDAVIEACVTRSLDDLDPPLLDALRLGAHQLLATRVPAHAAVSTSVDLVRRHVNEGAARLANAVLRRIGERDLDGWAAELAPSREEDLVGHLAFRHAHPAWIVRAFRDALKGDDAELEATLRADNEPAEVTLAARPGRATVEELAQAGARATRWSPFGAVLESGSPARLAAVRDGRAGVQDEGSQLVALALATAPVEPPDERWLDLCAGPGGKAALLAGLLTQRGGRLLAVEQHEHRARLVAQALAGDPGEHEILVGDATKPEWPEADFDRVLLDAPCTGLGALRRRPEARWRRRPADVAGLRRLQADLLRSALWSVRPGGLVAYVTCSPHLAETVTVVDDVLRGRDDAERVDARPYLPGVPDLGDGPDVQLWPHRHGTDAMYLALLRRTE
ncbi:transcription antitermination factor NusB [Jiangella mangrovi]|uniref:16S rRNA (Cytosine967-C5)-methyltransferase n=1 Tax=Jiangella mangrovi TaxID=1524084 RepID=A0A7W9GSR2_9ACTN|nr:16S rRNA (cytosine967-C5)-methyltransferase [Jiangella mangrovi]